MCVCVCVCVCVLPLLRSQVLLLDAGPDRNLCAAHHQHTQHGGPQPVGAASCSDGRALGWGCLRLLWHGARPVLRLGAQVPAPGASQGPRLSAAAAAAATLHSTPGPPYATVYGQTAAGAFTSRRALHGESLRLGPGTAHCIFRALNPRTARRCRGPTNYWGKRITCFSINLLDK